MDTLQFHEMKLTWLDGGCLLLMEVPFLVWCRKLYGVGHILLVVER